MQLSANQIQKFWARTKRSETTDCIVWTGRFRTNGYGRCSIASCDLQAHRVSWEIHNGPIPDGFWVLHRCDNRPCVNPLHLFLGTHTDNMRDCAAKGRIKSRYHEATHCIHGHELSGDNLYVRFLADGTTI